MRIDDLPRSDNVEDRRGMSVGRAGAGVGIGTLLVVVVGYFLGVSPSTLMGVLQGDGAAATDAQQAPAGPLSAEAKQDPQVDFVRAVLGGTEETWTAILAKYNQQYPKPTLSLFRGQVVSGCGQASTLSGPFYCPVDGNVYLDLDFFDELSHRFGAPGDFARAYVIAHEVGHHIQTISGATEQLQKAKSRLRDDLANQLQVDFELQADCYAGLWARNADSAHKILQAGDLEDAMRAAQAVGDDTLQKQAQGYVVPDAFTHGTAAQRAHWFKAGFDGGTLESCDTSGSGAQNAGR